MAPGQALGRVAAHLCLIVSQAQAGEVLRKAFVEPFLRGGIVEIQKQVRKIMRDRPPAIFSRKIEDDVIAVVSVEKESLFQDKNRVA